MNDRDLQGYLECHQDKEAKKNFMSVPKTLQEAKKEINYRDSEEHKLAWVIEVNGEFAGFVHLKLNNNPKHKHSAIIGYAIHPKYRGKGIATDAIKAVTKYAFKKLKLVRISAMCRTFNKASAKALENAEYKLEGILRKNKYKNGKYLDDMLWAKVQ